MGRIRLHASPAPDVWHANTSTEYIAGPRASVSVSLRAAGLKPGDVAGLALSRDLHAWLALERSRDGFALAQFDEQSGEAKRIPLGQPRVWLRAECDLVDSAVRFSYSTDGTRFSGVGERCSMGDGRVAFQGLRCSLFSYRARPEDEGGHADFDAFVVTWP